MPTKCSDYFTLSCVPNLGITLISPYGQMLTSIAPSDTSNLVICWKFCQLLHLGGACAPDINCAIESNGKYILSAPINKIKVKIILQLGSIKNLEGHFVYLSSFLALVVESIIKGINGIPIET
jgi:hypothetical protein